MKRSIIAIGTGYPGEWVTFYVPQISSAGHSELSTWQEKKLKREFPNVPLGHLVITGKNVYGHRGSLQQCDWGIAILLN